MNDEEIAFAKFAAKGEKEVRRLLDLNEFAPYRARLAKRWLSMQSPTPPKPVADGVRAKHAEKEPDSGADWHNRPIGKLGLQITGAVLSALALLALAIHFGLPFYK